MSSLLNDKRFGAALCNEHFPHHPKNLIRLNNGSFGACPANVLIDQQRTRDKWMHCPDDFWNNDIAPGFRSSSEAVSHRLMGSLVDPSEVHIVENLTTAISIIAHSAVANTVKKNSVVLVNSFTYSAVRNAMNYGCSFALSKLTSESQQRVEAANSKDLAKGTTVTVCTVELPFPVLGVRTKTEFDAVVLTAYRAALERIVRVEGLCITLAVVDWVSSLPCMRMPVRELVALCREYGAEQVLVDGAHAPGQLSLEEVPELGADYFVANLHKWCLAPTAVAILWVSPHLPATAREQLHHPIVSHSFGQGIGAECAMLGTRDYSAMLSVPAALDFVDTYLGGVETLSARNCALCAHAVKMLSEAWDAFDQSYGKGGIMQRTASPGAAAVVGTDAELGGKYSSSDREEGGKGLSTLAASLAAAAQGLSMCMVGVPRVLGCTWEEGCSLKAQLRHYTVKEGNHSGVGEGAGGGGGAGGSAVQGIVVQNFYPVQDDRLYLRVSAAAYNHEGEFAVLRDAVLDLAHQKQKQLEL